jgi:hypothetical protein
VNAGLLIKLLPNVSLIVYSRYSPSYSKEFFLVLEQQEADFIKTQKQERRALRDKKAVQKANQLANIPSDGEGDYEPRTSPTVGFLLIYSSYLFLLLMTFSLSPGR